MKYKIVITKNEFNGKYQFAISEPYTAKHWILPDEEHQNYIVCSHTFCKPKFFKTEKAAISWCKAYINRRQYRKEIDYEV